MYITPINGIGNVRTNSHKHRAGKTKIVFKGVQEIEENYDGKVKKLSWWQRNFTNKKEILINEKNAAILGYAKAQEENFQEIKRLYEERAEMLKNAVQKNEDQEKIKELELKVAEAQNMMVVQQELMKVRKNHGWDRIAGYDQEKAVLDSNFIEPILLERKGEEIVLPNGILFFGPTGNGKTTFAKAFAEQSQCNFEEVSSLKASKLTDDLEDVLEKSKKAYKKDGRRTIILLDEFEKYGLQAELGGNRVLIANLKTIFNDCSDKYKATFFLTTNNPQDIDSVLLADRRAPIRVFLDPPDRTNAARVFEYYLNGKTTNNINIENLVDELMENKGDGAYSNSRIKTIVESVFKEVHAAKRLLTEGDVINKIKALGPDITKEHLVKYEADVMAIVRKAARG